jgi:hypothetical protein
MVPISGCSFLSEVLCMGTSGMHPYLRGADGRRSGFLGDEDLKELCSGHNGAINPIVAANLLIEAPK